MFIFNIQFNENNDYSKTDLIYQSIVFSDKKKLGKKILKKIS